MKNLNLKNTFTKERTNNKIKQSKTNQKPKPRFSGWTLKKREDDKDGLSKIEDSLIEFTPSEQQEENSLGKKKIKTISGTCGTVTEVLTKGL
jgi:hypothetical protein